MFFMPVITAFESDKVCFYVKIFMDYGNEYGSAVVIFKNNADVFETEKKWECIHFQSDIHFLTEAEPHKIEKSCIEILEKLG